jgi:hypothetical protein
MAGGHPHRDDDGGPVALRQIPEAPREQCETAGQGAAEAGRHPGDLHEAFWQGEAEIISGSAAERVSPSGAQAKGVGGSYRNSGQCLCRTERFRLCMNDGRRGAVGPAHPHPLCALRPWIYQTFAARVMPRLSHARGRRWRNAAAHPANRRRCRACGQAGEGVVGYQIGKAEGLKALLATTLVEQGILVSRHYAIAEVPTLTDWEFPVEPHRAAIDEYVAFLKSVAPAEAADRLIADPAVVQYVAVIEQIPIWIATGSGRSARPGRSRTASSAFEAQFAQSSDGIARRKP